jgi:hypothetical protein
LELKVENIFTRFVGCKVYGNKTDSDAWIGHQFMINRIDQTFEILLKEYICSRLWGQQICNIVQAIYAWENKAMIKIKEFTNQVLEDYRI